MAANNFFLKNMVLNNFVTFKNQTIDFTNNLNTIVGETGSGKSLIFDALQVLLGSRSDKKMIRKGSTYASLEAVFECNNLEIKNYFSEIGYPFDENEIVLKRIIFENGKSKSFLNFQQCALADIISFSKKFIDIVGQFENQKLLASDYQLSLLDHFAENSDLLKEYQNSYYSLQKLITKKKELEYKENTMIQRKEFIQFQIDELMEFSPSLEEYKNLLQKKELLKSAENINQIQNFSAQYLNTFSEDSVLNILNKAISLHQKNKNLFNESDLNYLYQAKELITDYCGVIEDLSGNSLSEEEINSLIERLDKYKKLEKKHSCTIDSLQSVLDSYKTELEGFNSIQNEIAQIYTEIDDLNKNVHHLAEKLHNLRLKASRELSKLITDSVRNLKMEHATIQLNIDKCEELTSFGFDKINIFAETNKGEGFFKLDEIVSGGELSRILLSFRKILSSKDSISIFLFDEIDSGIGGETALCIGKDLSYVASLSQVIAITHLPQIVFYSDNIVHVTKCLDISENNNRTFSEINIIDQKSKSQFLKDMVPINQ